MPFYMRAYLYQMAVRDAFVQRLQGRPLLRQEAGEILPETLLRRAMR
jgi:hypothetical protein